MRRLRSADRLREHTLRFPATVAGLAGAAESLRAFLDSSGLDSRRRYAIELTFDEIAGNIIRHGQPATDIEAAIAVKDAEALMTFEDDGKPFDPREPRVTPPAAPIERAQVGGLGLVLVKAYTTRIDYVRTPHNRNRTTFVLPLA